MSTAKLTIELLQDIANIGRKWSIIEASSSQARNFLIPKWLAREVTEERLKRMQIEKKREQDTARIRLEKAFELQTMLEGKRVTFALKGKNVKIFGWLGEHEVASKIREKFGIAFEKGDIKLPNRTHIKTVWEHLVYIHITRDTHAKIIVEVTLETA